MREDWLVGPVHVPLGEESWLRDLALSVSSSSLLGRMSAISTAMCLHRTSISNLRFSYNTGADIDSFISTQIYTARAMQGGDYTCR